MQNYNIFRKYANNPPRKIFFRFITCVCEIFLLISDICLGFLCLYHIIGLGGRAYPVRHYPIAIRLRDRKGRAILCLRLSSKWGLVGRCTRSAFRRTPSHKNSFTLLSGWSYAPRYSCRSKAKVNCFLHTKKRYASKTARLIAKPLTP